MGMFDKDKEIGRQLTSEFKENEEFVLHGVNVEPESVRTDLGMADKTRMVVQRMDPASGANATIGEPFEITTLGKAIADKAKEAADTDFPAVVKWFTVPSKFKNDATVLQFARPFPGDSRAAEVWNS